MAKRRAAAPAQWRNRIVKHGMQAADQFLANPDNWRIHPAGQQEALRRIIGVEVGWVQSVIVNMRTSKKWPAGQRNVETMLDGHERVQLALRKDDKEPVPTVWVDLDPDEERLVLATFDPIGQLAVEDRDKLGELEGILQERHSDLLDLVATGVMPGDGGPPKKAKGLRHTVHACTCCADGKCTDPDCGCYREAPE
jgi:hypothetical protein